MCILVKDKSSQVNPGITPQCAPSSPPRPPNSNVGTFLLVAVRGRRGRFSRQKFASAWIPKTCALCQHWDEGVGGGILLVIREHVHITTQQHLWSTCELLSFTCLVLRTFVLESVYARKMVTRTRACMAPDMQSMSCMYVCMYACMYVCTYTFK